MNENRKLSLVVSPVESRATAKLLCYYHQQLNKRMKQNNTTQGKVQRILNERKNTKRRCCFFAASCTAALHQHQHMGSHSQSCNTIEVKWTEIYLTNSKCVYAQCFVHASNDLIERIRI